MTGEIWLPSGYKSQEALSVMKNLYLDIDREEQGKIVNELSQKTSLSLNKLSKALGFSRTSLFFYRQGKHRMPCLLFSKLCSAANVDVNKYRLEFVEIDNKGKGEKADLSRVDESQFNVLEPEKWQKVVAAGLITDGSLYHRKYDNKYMMTFCSTDKDLHAFFQKMVLISFNEGPSSFLKVKRKNLWLTCYGRGQNNPMIKRLLSFSKTYLTYKGKKPSLDFLLGERNEVKTQALRFAMSCDGSVSIKKASCGGKSFSLRLACAHPELNEQWKELFRDIGIEMRIDRDKNTWSGIHGLASGKKDSFRRFSEIGGFLPTNVKSTNGNFVGIEKNEVLKKILGSIDGRPPKPL